MATWADGSTGSRVARSLEIPFKADGENYGNGIVDATAHLQGLLDSAQAVGGTVLLPPGYNFKVTALATSDSFTQPSIEALGSYRGVTISSAGSGPIITINGGSGDLCGAHIKGVSFTGASATAISLRGIGGFRIQDCEFDELTLGVQFYNLGAGEFTEFNVIERCRFTSGTTTHIEYKVGAGNDSFHGSGFKDCVFNQDSADTGPKIAVRSGAKVYSAPWSGTFFAAAPGVPLILNDGDPVIAHGDLSIEAPGTGGDIQIVDQSSASSVNLAGKITGLGQDYRLGTALQLVDQARYNEDSSITSLASAQNTTYALTTGANTLMYVNGITIVGVRVTATNYDYFYLLSVYQSPFNDGGSVTTLATHETINGAGYGAPVFSVSGYALVITNAGYPASGVTAYVGVRGVIGGQAFPLI